MQTRRPGAVSSYHEAAGLRRKERFVVIWATFGPAYRPGRPAGADYPTHVPQGIPGHPPRVLRATTPQMTVVVALVGRSSAGPTATHAQGRVFRSLKDPRSLG